MLSFQMFSRRPIHESRTPNPATEHPRNCCGLQEQLMQNKCSIFHSFSPPQLVELIRVAGTRVQTRERGRPKEWGETLATRMTSINL